MTVIPKQEHQHMWEYRGRKIKHEPSGIWVSQYVCNKDGCGAELSRPFSISI